MNKLSLTLIPLFFLFTFVFLLISSAQAEENVTLSIAPAIIETKIDPGQGQDQIINLTNVTASSQAVKAYANNFFASDQEGGMDFSDVDDTSFSGSKWLKFEKSDWVLGPGKMTSVKFRIEVPHNAEPGGHYVTVFFEPVKGVGFSDNSSLGITGRLGALLFITVNGPAVEDGQVLGASTDQCRGASCSFQTKRFLEYGPVPFTFQFENTGNIHTKVQGKIEIFNIFGQKIDEVPVDEKTVLPQTTRKFETKWMRELLLGRYRANLTIEFGSGTGKQTASVVFWGFPWKIFFLILVVAVASIISSGLIIRKRGRLRKKIIRKNT